MIQVVNSASRPGPQDTGVGISLPQSGERDGNCRQHVDGPSRADATHPSRPATRHIGGGGGPLGQAAFAAERPTAPSMPPKYFIPQSTLYHKVRYYTRRNALIQTEYSAASYVLSWLLEGRSISAEGAPEISVCMALGRTEPISSSQLLRGD